MSVLIGPAELRADLDSPRPPVVLDIRWSLGDPSGRAGYEAGHIPGARFCDLPTILAAPSDDAGGGRHPLPTPDAFQTGMRELGVCDDLPVVVYDENGGMGAARGWWCLRYFGHNEVRFLDGGYRAWVETGFAVSSDIDPARSGDFTVRPGGMPLLDADDAAALAGTGVLLDARAAPRYRGDEEPIDPAAGHIPGAISAPFTENEAPNGRFLPLSRLRERFADLGIGVPGEDESSRPVGVYCGSGISAAHEVLALELIGVPAALYVGSWSDWVGDPERAIATGAEPG